MFSALFTTGNLALKEQTSAIVNSKGVTSAAIEQWKNEIQHKIITDGIINTFGITTFVGDDGLCYTQRAIGSMLRRFVREGHLFSADNS